SDLVNIPEEDTALQEQLVQNPTYQTLLKQVVEVYNDSTRRKRFFLKDTPPFR
ncbi:hypothetical protein AAULR_09375, partial [Lacticaseibacillus rhamnosus MTCC 5462]